MNIKSSAFKFFVLMIILGGFFSYHSVFAEPIMYIDNLSETSVTLDAQGLEPDTDIKFTLTKIGSAAPAVFQISKSDSEGIAISIFNNLASGGHYSVDISYSGATAILYTLNFYTYRDISMSVTGVTDTKATLTGTGFNPNSEITFKVNNYDTTTAAYSTTQPGVSDDNGSVSSEFIGLTGDGHYKATVKYKNGTETLYTVNFYAAAPAVVLPGGNNPPATGGGDGSSVDLSTAGKGLTVPCGAKGCGFNDLIAQVKKVVNFILFSLAVPIAAIMFAYAGFELITSGGEAEKRGKAKRIFTNVALGLVFAAAAWLIVHTILGILGYDSSWSTWFGF